MEFLDESENFPVVANEAEIPEVIVIDSDSEVETIESLSKNVMMSYRSVQRMKKLTALIAKTRIQLWLVRTTK